MCCAAAFRPSMEEREKCELKNRFDAGAFSKSQTYKLKEALESGIQNIRNLG